MTESNELGVLEKVQPNVCIVSFPPMSSSSSNQDKKGKNSLLQRLQQVQGQTEEEAMTEQYQQSSQMRDMIISFGEKYKGKSFETTFQDQSYVAWFVAHCKGIGKHQEFHHYIQLRVQEAEAELNLKNKHRKIPEKSKTEGKMKSSVKEEAENQEWMMARPVDEEDSVKSEIKMELQTEMEEILTNIQMQHQQEMQANQVRIQRLEEVVQQLVQKMSSLNL